MELKIKDLSLNYFGHQDSLHSINHTFKQGLNVIFGLVGSGKTSLLKAIGGINHIHDGGIFLDDNPLITGKESSISFVFDDLGFFERRSLKYNLAYPLKIRKTPKRDVESKISEWLDKFGLSPNLLDVAAFRLSPENRVKAALLRGFYRDSDIIILDNPLNGLDPSARKTIFLFLAKLMKSSSSILIYATDSQDEVKLLNADTLVLSYGYKAECGNANNLLDNPESLVTAISLVPYYNSFEAKIRDNSFNLFGHKFSLDLKGSLAESYEDKDVVVGFKPDAVKTGELKCAIGLELNTPDGVIYQLICDNNELYSSVKTYSFDLDLDKIVLFDKITERVIYKK